MSNEEDKSIGRPKVEDKTTLANKRIATYITEIEDKQLVELAKSKGLSKSLTIRHAIQELIKNNQTDK